MKLGITMLIHNKDDIEFVTEFPRFLGHPVQFRPNHMWWLLFVGDTRKNGAYLEVVYKSFWAYSLLCYWMITGVFCFKVEFAKINYNLYLSLICVIRVTVGSVGTKLDRGYR